ncbi:glycoside hydrolase family protein [Spirosoma aerolatum]|uniref:glycoside hydrolase family protein n=1 Tax=Spirosoma aerolatum TaxID=1211326 RepID=UPI0009ADD61B|nr:glycoside hydrolase family protein [Spirosoma aerolatum]
MMTRRNFLTGLTLLPFTNALADGLTVWPFDDNRAEFSKHLKPVGRALESPDWYVSANSPIYGPNGSVHLFYSRWPADRKADGWLNGAEIAHAVAKSPESAFEYVETVLAPRPGQWDATTCHTPHIQYIDGRYCLFYTGNSNGQPDTQRIGLATAKSLKGPWKRSDTPLLEPGTAGAWDDHCTTNPAFIQHPNGQYWLYYQSGKTSNSAGQGYQKYGLATANLLQGPYRRYSKKPIIDFSSKGKHAQIDDAFVWLQRGRFNMLLGDMGVQSNNAGLYLDSHDGVHWEDPSVAFGPLNDYVKESPTLDQGNAYGRLEHPQLLLQHGRPRYLFTAAQGGKYMTSSPFIFKIV